MLPIYLDFFKYVVRFVSISTSRLYSFYCLFDLTLYLLILVKMWLGCLILLLVSMYFCVARVLQVCRMLTLVLLVQCMVNHDICIFSMWFRLKFLLAVVQPQFILFCFLVTDVFNVLLTQNLLDLFHLIHLVTIWILAIVFHQYQSYCIHQILLWHNI